MRILDYTILDCISTIYTTTSRLHLDYISTTSRLHLDYIYEDDDSVITTPPSHAGIHISPRWHYILSEKIC